MAKKAILPLQTPVGDLNWMFIHGEGRETDNGDFRYSGSVYFEKETAEVKAFIKKLLDFWEKEKPSGAKKPKSFGVYNEIKVEDDEAPEGTRLSQKAYGKGLDEGEEFTGRVIVSAWTGTTMPDGKAKTVSVFNAKAVQVSLGDKLIGAGSRGALKVAAGVYDNGSNKGLSLYLNAVIISKFVEYTATDAVESIDDGEGWTGEDLNEEGVEALPEETSTGEEQTAEVTL